jgi:hypothetical protein
LPEGETSGQENHPMQSIVSRRSFARLLIVGLFFGIAGINLAEESKPATPKPLPNR